MQEEPGSKNIVLRIKQVIRETADTKSFLLEPVNHAPLHYTSGQFLTLLFHKRNGEEARRNYSIASAAVLSEPLAITVKRIANGEYSRWLVDKAKEGDELVTIGASGFFTLPGDLQEDTVLFFFAAGSGIVPVFSLIKTALHQHQQVPVVLIYSNTSPSNTIFYQQLQVLQQQFAGRLQVIFLFSTAADLSKARLNVDLLQRLLKQHATGPAGDQLFYLCGPFDYMRMITIALQGNGVPAANIRKEIFNIEKPAQKIVPPDQDAHGVHVVLSQQEYDFHAQYPATILQSAKALGIPLPYSCESGQCGTCAATCVKGKVWMWHNDVLLDEEIAKGRVLTCTGYAVEGDVVLMYGD